VITVGNALSANHQICITEASHPACEIMSGASRKCRQTSFFYYY